MRGRTIIGVLGAAGLIGPATAQEQYGSIPGSGPASLPGVDLSSGQPTPGGPPSGIPTPGPVPGSNSPGQPGSQGPLPGVPSSIPGGTGSESVQPAPGFPTPGNTLPPSTSGPGVNGPYGHPSNVPGAPGGQGLPPPGPQSTVFVTVPPSPSGGPVAGGVGPGVPFPTDSNAPGNPGAGSVSPGSPFPTDPNASGGPFPTGAPQPWPSQNPFPSLISSAAAGTCPLPQPTTVFVSVTPSVLPTVVSTVLSTLLSTISVPVTVSVPVTIPVTVSAAPGSGEGEISGPAPWSPPRTVTSPCSTLPGGPQWPTTNPTFTLPTSGSGSGSDILGWPSGMPSGPTAPGVPAQLPGSFSVPGLSQSPSQPPPVFVTIGQPTDSNGLPVASSSPPLWAPGAPSVSSNPAPTGLGGQASPQPTTIFVTPGQPIPGEPYGGNTPQPVSTSAVDPIATPGPSLIPLPNPNGPFGQGLSSAQPGTLTNIVPTAGAPGSTPCTTLTLTSPTGFPFPFPGGNGEPQVPAVSATLPASLPSDGSGLSFTPVASITPSVPSTGVQPGGPEVSTTPGGILFTPHVTTIPTIPSPPVNGGGSNGGSIPSALTSTLPGTLIITVPAGNSGFPFPIPTGGIPTGPIQSGFPQDPNAPGNGIPSAPFPPAGPVNPNNPEASGQTSTCTSGAVPPFSDPAGSGGAPSAPGFPGASGFPSPQPGPGPVISQPGGQGIPDPQPSVLPVLSGTLPAPNGPGSGIGQATPCSSGDTPINPGTLAPGQPGGQGFPQSFSWTATDGTLPTGVPTPATSPGTPSPGEPGLPGGNFPTAAPSSPSTPGVPFPGQSAGPGGSGSQPGFPIPSGLSHFPSILVTPLPGVPSSPLGPANPSGSPLIPGAPFPGQPGQSVEPGNGLSTSPCSTGVTLPAAVPGASSPFPGVPSLPTISQPISTGGPVPSGPGGQLPTGGGGIPGQPIPSGPTNPLSSGFTTLPSPGLPSPGIPGTAVTTPNIPNPGTPNTSFLPPAGPPSTGFPPFTPGGSAVPVTSDPNDNTLVPPGGFPTGPASSPAAPSAGVTTPGSVPPATLPPSGPDATLFPVPGGYGASHSIVPLPNSPIGTSFLSGVLPGEGGQPTSPGSLPIIPTQPSNGSQSTIGPQPTGIIPTGDNGSNIPNLSGVPGPSDLPSGAYGGVLPTVPSGTQPIETPGDQGLSSAAQLPNTSTLWPVSTALTAPAGLSTSSDPSVLNPTSAVPVAPVSSGPAGNGASTVAVPGISTPCTESGAETSVVLPGATNTVGSVSPLPTVSASPTLSAAPSGGWNMTSSATVHITTAAVADPLTAPQPSTLTTRFASTSRLPLPTRESIDPKTCVSMVITTVSSHAFTWCAQPTPSSTLAIVEPASPTALTRRETDGMRIGSGGDSLSERDATCGSDADVGAFSFDFRDIPLSSDNSLDQHIPMLSPYHRLWFSRSFSIKASAQASLPASPVLQFHPDLTRATGLGEAMISVGPQTASSCFSFDFYGANLGCSSFYGGCHFKVTGSRYDEATGLEAEVASETFHIQGCKDIKSCQLQPIVMSTLRGLTSITVNAEADGLPATWWSDNLMLGWSDNSCETSLCRSAVRDSIRRRDWMAYRR